MPPTSDKPPTKPPATTADFEFLLARRNVVAVEYDPLSNTVEVWVSRKLTPDELSEDDDVTQHIPDAFNVDVHDVGMGEDRDYFTPDDAFETEDMHDYSGGPPVDVLPERDTTRAQKHRPVKSSVSESHYRGTAATGGLLAQVVNPDAPDAEWSDDIEAGDIVRLSNNHVYAEQNTASFGDDIQQQSPYDGGRGSANAIGKLAGYVPLKHNIDVDIAARTVDFNGGDTGGVFNLPVTPTGVMRSAYHLLKDTKVVKGGRTTGVTYGRVTGVNATGNVGYGGSLGVVRMPNQIITTDMSAGGDSGSPVFVAEGPLKGQTVGELYAGSSTVTLVNKAGVVEQRHGVRQMPEKLTSFEGYEVTVPMKDPTLEVVGTDVPETPGVNDPARIDVRVVSNYQLPVWVTATGPVDTGQATASPGAADERDDGTYEFTVSVTVTAPATYSNEFSVSLDGGYSLDGEAAAAAEESNGEEAA